MKIDESLMVVQTTVLTNIIFYINIKGCCDPKDSHPVVSDFRGAALICVCGVLEDFQR